MNTQLRASSGGPAETGSADRPTALLSPVSGALFTASSCASTTRQSADTASPASSTTTSPGTSSRAATSSRSPPRSTRQVWGTIAASAWAVRSAEYSWAKPMAAFSTTTPRIATASCKVPMSRGSSSQYARKVIPDATISTTAKRSVNWAPNCRHTARRRVRGSSLAPYRSSPACARAADRPRREVSSAVKTSSATSCRTAGGGLEEGAAPTASLLWDEAAITASRAFDGRCAGAPPSAGGAFSSWAGPADATRAVRGTGPGRPPPQAGTVMTGQRA